MPCWERRIVSANLDVADRDILIAGLKAAGFIVALDGQVIRVRKPQSGIFEIREAQGRLTVCMDERLSAAQPNLITEIKQAYGREVVKSQAARFGWAYKEQHSEPNKLVFQRRGF